MLVQGFLDGLKPEPRLALQEWADKHRYLAPESSAEPGRWRTSRVPYMEEIMGKLSSHDPTKEIIMMKGAQIAFTEVAFCWIGYTIDTAPGPFLAVQPTQDTIKRASKQRFTPMVEATPRLSEKIAARKSRSSSNTILQKDFPGGTLVFTGANSAASLRSMPMRYLFLDEIDAYPQDLDGEGSPVELAEARTRTFSRKKILKGSTPTVDSLSRIQDEFLDTDQRYYQVPCPHCGEYQKLIFGSDEEYGLKWDKGKPETVMYYCYNCGAGIEERYKTKMLAQGKWVPEAPENSSAEKVGYHLSSLYSPYGWYSWQEAAEDWEEAQEDVNKLKSFVNTVLGEVWVERGESPPWENLYNRREQYELNKPPREVCFLTAGVDVQKDRLEVEIVGWCKKKRTYSIDYRVLQGDTAKSDVWDDLAEIVNEKWERADGAIMPLARMAVDSGYNTSHVYDFCRRFDQTRVVPVKGSDRQQTILSSPRKVDSTASGKKVGKVSLFTVGVGLLKSELYGWLRSEIDREGEEPEVPPGYCFFPEYAQRYFKGLTAERLQVKTNNKGFRKYEWVKHYERNEPLDCRVYARAAAALVGIDRFEEKHFEEMRAQYKKKKTGKKRKKRGQKTDYWD